MSDNIPLRILLAILLMLVGILGFRFGQKNWRRENPAGHPLGAMWMSIVIFIAAVYNILLLIFS
jgi:hypothetical protein